MFAYTKYLKNYKKQTIIAPIFKWLEAVFELIVPLIAAVIIDKAIPNQNVSQIIRLGIVLVVLGALGLWFALICQKNATIAAHGFGKNLRNHLFEHILSLPAQELDKLGGSHLKTALNSDVYQMETAVSRFLRLVVRSPFLVAGAVVMTFFIDVKIALVMLVFSLICGVALYILTTKTVKYLQQNQKHLQTFTQITSENLSGAKAVKAFGKQNHEKQRFEQTAQKLYYSSIKLGRLNAALNPVSQVIIHIGIIAILYVSKAQVNLGRLTTGEVVAVINYMYQILAAIGMIITIMGIFSRAHASSLRLQAILDIKPHENAANTTLINGAQGEFIEFKNVCFSYLKDGKYSLKDINFTVKKGQAVGIIGTTGSGKTTLAELLKGLYKPDCGAIFIDGSPLATFDQNKIGVSFQNIRLFLGTVRTNLQLANQSLNDTELENALKAAQAYNFVWRKDGLDTIVHENGTNFSGGQRQRLSIARALANSPQILILDDSFSALDTRTAKRIRMRLEKEQIDAKFIISQRITDIRNCDLILMLKDGQILCQGTHSYMLKNCDMYSQICKVQEEE